VDVVERTEMNNIISKDAYYNLMLNSNSLFGYRGYAGVSICGIPVEVDDIGNFVLYKSCEYCGEKELEHKRCGKCGAPISASGKEIKEISQL
jgi:hypothetical protein